MRCSALTFAFVLFFGHCGAAQLSYEGQPVSSVELIANPHLDAESFRPVVLQHAHSPYSEGQVQASVAALKRQGAFPRVDVEVTPEADGLRVTFVMQPAYAVGVLEFPGADKVFSYTRLLQVANLPDGQAFDASRLPAARTALLHFFGSSGYFRAEVSTDTALDDRDLLANPIFRVNLMPIARLGAIKIEGAPPGLTARLRHALVSLRSRLTGGLLKPGKPYTPDRMKTATQTLKRTLSKQGYLDSRLELSPPEYQAAGNRVDASFHVQLGALVAVRVAGAKFSWFGPLDRRRKKRLLPIYQEGTVDRDLVSEGERNIRDYFQRQGYFEVAVKADYQRKPDLISVQYDVAKGKRRKVRGIALEGNHHLASARLLSQLTVKKHHFLGHGQFSEKLLRTSVNGISAVYTDNGYEQIKVEPQVSETQSGLDIRFTISEGPQTTVRQLAVEGNRALTLAQLAPPGGLRLRPGEAFSASRMREDGNRIAAAYLDRGYLNADVKTTVARTAGDTHQVDVVYRIEEQQKVEISRVIYVGHEHTRQSLLTSTAGIFPQTPFSQGKLLSAESDLYNLGIFDWSSVGPGMPITTQTAAAAIVKVHESKRNTLTYGIGLEITRRGGNVPTGTIAVPGLPPIGTGNVQLVSSEATFVSPRGSIGFMRRNLRGRGETATASLLLSRLDQRALATYTLPHLEGSAWSALTSVSAERTTENPLFAADLGDASLQVERTIDRARVTRFQLRYDYNRTLLSALLVPQLVLPQDRNLRLSTFSATLIRDTRDQPLDAHRGRYETLNLALTPAVLGSNASFAKAFGQYAYYRLLGSTVWASSVRLGLAKPFAGSFVPTSQSFFSGGGTSLRGFPLNGAGPQRAVKFCGDITTQTDCAYISVPVGGNQLFVFNTEVRFPLRLIENLGGVVFYDGGNIDQRINFNEFIHNYTNTLGIGFRYHTPIGPLRIDVGHNLNPTPGVGATQYFITLGQAF
jgi:outer membrane protein insertion porin family